MAKRSREDLIVEFIRLARTRYGHVSNWQIESSYITRRITDDELAEEIRQLEMGAASQVAFDLGKDRKRTPTTG